MTNRPTESNREPTQKFIHITHTHTNAIPGQLCIHVKLNVSGYLFQPYTKCKIKNDF
jgi:hypothetical protein